MRGVPTEMKSKKELSTFLARFLLPVIQHSAANYPIYPYVMYYPMQAGLLFEPQGEENMLNMMPNATTVIVSKCAVPIVPGCHGVRGIMCLIKRAWH